MNIDAQDFDLIGYRIVSPFHLMALTAFSQNILPEKKTLKLLIIVSKGPWKEKILKSSSIADPRIEATFIEEEALRLKFYAWWPLFLLLRPFLSWVAKLTNKAQIPVCAPSLSCIRFSSRSLLALWRLEPFIIDEGIGSFNSTQNFRREAKRKFRSKWIQLLALVGFRLMYVCLPLFGGRRITLFDFKHQRPVLNDSVADTYRRVFEMGYHARGVETKFAKPVVLLLTQPFAETGVCSSEDLAAELQKWINRIRLKGLEPVLKFHPAENPSKYNQLGIRIVEYDGPVEEVLAGASGDIAEIWGFTSTSLITGKALYGIPSRRMELPWPEATVEVFKDEALSLFLTYTESVEEIVSPIH